MITRNLKQRLYTSIVLIALIITIFYSKFFLLYSLIVLGVLSIIEFFGIIKKILKNKYKLKKFKAHLSLSDEKKHSVSYVILEKLK